MTICKKWFLYTLPALLCIATACGGDSIGVTDDAGPGPDSGVLPDAFVFPDGGVSATCGPAVVSDDLCIDCFNPEFLGAFFDGLGCYELWGCACEDDGSGDCARAFSTVAECEAAHATCDAVVCVDTGGEWFPAEPCGPCGHYDCGVPSALGCCDAGCNCGPGQRFVTGVGCVESPNCEAQLSCLATSGQWHPATECICGYSCGQPNDCQACVDSCDCGPFRNFNGAAGCTLDPGTCGAADEQGLCEATAGTWHETDGGCGHFFCGQPNLMDPCVAPGCDCGPYGNFHTDVGCVWDDACILLEAGQPCLGSGHASNCRPGLVCCDGCGMPPGCPTCQQPCCSDSPACENNGCPLPPP